LIDSDALIALMKEDDINNIRAKKIFNKVSNLDVMFIMTCYVFSEVVTVLSQRVGYNIALKFIDTVKSSEGGLRVIYADRMMEDATVEVFKKQSSKNISFVDCLNIAVLKNNYANCIFSFDKVYKKNGCKLLEEILR
jgi:predicted nucleic acid-binding protein